MYYARVFVAFIATNYKLAARGSRESRYCYYLPSSIDIAGLVCKILITAQCFFDSVVKVIIFYVKAGTLFTCNCPQLFNFVFIPSVFERPIFDPVHFYSVKLNQLFNHTSKIMIGSISSKIL
jgi:hypothetical protein